MTEDRDPMLQALFANAEQDLQAEAFTHQVMASARLRKRRTVIGWICIDLVIVICVWLLAAPLQSVVNLLLPSLTTSLVDLDNRLLAELLLPVNNVASLLALVAIGLRSAYRRFFL
jgi:hypothetical protein